MVHADDLATPGAGSTSSRYSDDDVRVLYIYETDALMVKPSWHGVIYDLLSV